MLRNRLIWGIMWIASLVLISFYGGPISYGIFFLLTFIPLVSFLYLIYTYLFFHMYQKVDSKWLVVDDTSPFYFTLVNDYHIIFTGIRVKFYADFSSITGLSEKTEYEFFPKSGITLETNLTCKCRGEYEVGIKTVVIEDYFRLLSLTYKNKEPLKVVVRPKIVRLEALNLADISLSNKDLDTISIEPDVLTRAYVLGDDIRQVHWGLSAKSGELMIRKRTGLEQLSIGVILINKREYDNPLEYLPIENKMLETVLALTMYVVDKKIPVNHYHKGLDIITKSLSGVAEFDDYYELISGVSFESDFEVSGFLYEVSTIRQLLDSKTVFIVTSSFDQSLTEVLSIYRGHNIDVVIYFIGHELPKMLEALSMPRVKVMLIGPFDDLMEVM